MAGAQRPDLPPAAPPQLWVGGHIWLWNGVYFWLTTGAEALSGGGSQDPDIRANLWLGLYSEELKILAEMQPIEVKWFP